MKHIINRTKQGIFFLVILCVTAFFVACGDGNSQQNPTGTEDPVATTTITPTTIASTTVPTITITPTVTEAPIATPTAVPTPTTVPYSGYTAAGTEGSLYRIEPEIFGIEDYCDAIQLFQVGDTPVLLYVTEYNSTGTTKINFISFDPSTGEILNAAMIPMAAYYEHTSLVNEEGLLRVLDMDTVTYYYLDETLTVVRELCLYSDEMGDAIPYLSRDDSVFYYDIYDYSESKAHIYGKEVASGLLTDYSECVADCYYATIADVLYNGELVVVEGSDPQTFNRVYYFITKDGEVRDYVSNDYLVFSSEGTDLAASYYKYFPELLISHNASRQEVICYQYRDPGECTSFLYLPAGNKRPEDILFTTYRRDAGEDVNDYTSEGVLTMLSPMQNKMLYETVYQVPGDMIYLGYPTVYLEDSKCVLGVGSSLDKQFLYLWDLSAEELCEESETELFVAFCDPEDPDEELFNAMQDRADTLGENYGVNILVGYHCDYQLDGYTAEPVVNLRLISKSLDIMEEVFEAYPADYFRQLGCDGTNPITFQLVATLRGQGGNTLDIAGALYTYDSEHQMVAIDCTNYTYLKQNIYHEISHATDWYIWNSQGNRSYDDAWAEQNPVDFTYDNSYTAEMTNDTYCYQNDDNPEDDYFIDQYAKTYPTEDRARLTEYSYGSGVEQYEDCPHIIGKLKLMYETICEVFDTADWNGDFFSYDEYFGTIE